MTTLELRVHNRYVLVMINSSIIVVKCVDDAFKSQEKIEREKKKS